MANIPVNVNDRYVIVTATTNGQTDFDFDFLAFTIDQLSATHIRASDGFETALGHTSDFSASGLNNANGGTVSLINTTIVIGDKIVIYGDTPIQRLSDFQQAGDFKAETVNTGEDLQTMMMQEMERDIWRSLKLPLGEGGTEFSIQAGDYLRRKEDGTGFEGVVPQVAVSSVEAWFQNRDNTSALQAALLTNGSIVSLAGVLYVVDDTVGEASATHDLGVDGLSYVAAVRFKDRAAVIADTLTHYPIGTVISTDHGLTYEVSSGASHVQTAGGVNLTDKTNRSPIIVGDTFVDARNMGTFDLNGGSDVSAILQEMFGDGVADGANALPIGATVYFPDGILKVTSPITIKRNLNVVLSSDTTIRGDMAAPIDDILTVDIDPSLVTGDVARNFKISGGRMFHNPAFEGRHALVLQGNQIGTIVEGMSLAGLEKADESRIEHALKLTGYVDNTNFGATYAIIRCCQLNNAYIFDSVPDGNRLENCRVFGKLPGVINIVEGGFSTVISGGHHVSRDGQLHVVNGSMIRIVDVQIEQAGGEASQATTFGGLTWQVLLEGRDRTCRAISFEGATNFGGGIGIVDAPLIIDNASDTELNRSMMHPGTQSFDVRLTSNSKNNHLSPRLRGTRSAPSRVADNDWFSVQDLGEGNSGFWKPFTSIVDPATGAAVVFTSSWSSEDAWLKKALHGRVEMKGTLTAGTGANYEIIMVLPVGLRPITHAFISVPIVSAGVLKGTAAFVIAPDGTMRLTDNSGTLGNVTSGDQIELSGVSYQAAHRATYDPSA